MNGERTSPGATAPGQGLLHFRPFAGQPPVPGEYVRVGVDGTTSLVMEGNGCVFPTRVDVAGAPLLPATI